MDVNQEGRVDRFDVVDGWIIIGKLLIGELHLTVVLAEGYLLEALVLAGITRCLDVVFVGEQAVNMPTVLHALGEIPYHTDILFHHGRRHRIGATTPACEFLYNGGSGGVACCNKGAQARTICTEKIVEVLVLIYSNVWAVGVHLAVVHNSNVLVWSDIKTKAWVDLYIEIIDIGGWRQRIGSTCYCIHLLIVIQDINAHIHLGLRRISQQRVVSTIGLF